MDEKLIVAYFAIWLVCAVTSTLLFLGRNPEFKKKWYLPVSLINLAIIGGMLVIVTLRLPAPLWFCALLAAVLLFFGWTLAFRMRVCPSCGKVAHPEYLVLAQKFCANCRRKL